MRSKTATATDSRTYFDPARWLHQAAAQSVQASAARHLTVVPRTAPDHLVAGDGLSVECLDWEEASDRLEDWHALTKECHETNVFLEPAFALSAAQHYPPAHRPFFLFVTKAAAPQDRGRLVGLFAISRPRGAGATSFRLWQPPEMPLANPLIHREHGFDVLDAVFAWLRREYPAGRSLMYPAIQTEDAVATLLQRHAIARKLQVCQFEPRTRAILVKDTMVRERLLLKMGAKRSKELRRLRRRLAEVGEISYRTANTGIDVRNATEEFLALEARGWKGLRGTAMLADPSLATFARTMTRRFAINGQCEIDGLFVDGRPVAMGVVLRVGSQAFFWKTAYDEDYAAYSPGVQLTLLLTQRLLDDPTIERINSCALPNHPMIDKIWPDRMIMVDLMVSLQEQDTNAFLTVASLEGARRKLRGLAKKTYYRLKRRQPS